MEDQKICEKHRKFAAYWENLGKPPQECKTDDEEDDEFLKVDGKPTWFDTLDYRLAGDRHWKLRKEWIDSDFKLPIEVRIPNEEWRLANGYIALDKDLEYRKKPVSEPECAETDTETEVIVTPPSEPVIVDFTTNLADLKTEEIDPNFPEPNFAEKPKIDWGPELEDQIVTPLTKTEIRYTNGDNITYATYLHCLAQELERVQDNITYATYLKNIKIEEDTGQHYRFVYRAAITPEAVQQGYVEVKLDPFRIAGIYELTDFALQTILKKTLCAGNRGHNDLREDLKDIICAAQRKLEMLDENELLSETIQNKERS